MSKNPKEFKIWWDKVSMEGDWDYENYAELGWIAALDWAEERIKESIGVGNALSKIIQELESPYTGDDNELDKSV